MDFLFHKQCVRKCIDVFHLYLHSDSDPFMSAAVGDTVSEDEVVCEIETDKVTLNS